MKESKAMRRMMVMFLATTVVVSCETPRHDVDYIDLTTSQLDILFVSESQGYSQIFAVKDTALDEIWNVSFPFGNVVSYGQFDPTWSPDGRKYAFTNAEVVYSRQLIHANILIFNMDSTTFFSAIHQVTYDTIQLDTGAIIGTLSFRPDWSPDGHNIVYVSNRTGDYNVFFSRLSDSLTGDSSATRLTSAADSIGFYCFPSFAPDGSKIVYTSSRTGREEIFTMNTDGSEKFQVTNLGGSIKRRPRYSPNGQKILFTTNAWVHGNDSLQVFSINPDGTGLDTITSSGNNYDAAWSPDGQSIIYAKRLSPTKSYLYISNTDGSNESQLVNDSKSYYPIWRRK